MLVCEESGTEPEPASLRIIIPLLIASVITF